MIYPVWRCPSCGKIQIGEKRVFFGGIKQIRCRFCQKSKKLASVLLHLAETAEDARIWMLKFKEKMRNERN